MVFFGIDFAAVILAKESKCSKVPENEHVKRLFGSIPDSANGSRLAATIGCDLPI